MKPPSEVVLVKPHRAKWLTCVLNHDHRNTWSAELMPGYHEEFPAARAWLAGSAPKPVVMGDCPGQDPSLRAQRPLDLTTARAAVPGRRRPGAARPLSRTRRLAARGESPRCIQAAMHPA